MTLTEAKRILLRRREVVDDAEPEIAEALEAAQRDPELSRWLPRHEEFQRVMRDSFQAIPVPAGLAHRIITRAPATHLVWWRRFPAWVAAAAVLVALFVVLSQPGPEPTEERSAFPTFRSRMVRSVLRQYQMDLRTNNMIVIRTFLSTNQAPANYVLPAGLSRLKLVGAGLQRWQGQRVAMVCLDTGAQGTAVLFVVDSQNLTGPPPSAPVFERVSKLMTASWTNNGRAYVLMVDNVAVDQTDLERLL